MKPLLAAAFSAMVLAACATAPAPPTDLANSLTSISEARLLTVRVFVSDSARSARFYEQVFGLRVAQTVGHETILTFNDADRPGLVLAQSESPRANGSFAIGVPNIDEVAARVPGAGGTVTRPPRNMGPYRIAIITDPDGASIEVIQPAAAAQAAR